MSTKEIATRALNEARATMSIDNNKLAAKAIFIDLLDRRGIKQEIAKCTDDIVDEMLDMWAEIIKQANNND